MNLKIPYTTECAKPGSIGNRICDNENNHAVCNYDGLDCCEGDGGVGGRLDWIGDGECDDDNNNPQCNWDGGDCCRFDIVRTFCTECVCKERNIDGTIVTRSNCNFHFENFYVETCRFEMGYFIQPVSTSLSFKIWTNLNYDKIT